MGKDSSSTLCLWVQQRGGGTEKGKETKVLAARATKSAIKGIKVQCDLQ